MKSLWLAAGVIGLFLTGCSHETDSARIVGRIADNSRTITVECQGKGIPMTPADMDAFRTGVAGLQSVAAITPRSRSAGSETATARAPAAKEASQVDSFVVSMDGKHLIVNWSAKTVRFNDTWPMPTELETVLGKYAALLNKELKATR